MTKLKTYKQQVMSLVLNVRLCFFAPKACGFYVVSIYALEEAATENNLWCPYSYHITVEEPNSGRERDLPIVLRNVRRSPRSDS